MSLLKHWKACIAFGGYSAKTVVYCLLGIFVIRSAFSAFHADNPSQKNVFLTILHQPFGQALLAGVIFGMLCYVVWRIVQTIFNPNDLDMHSGRDVITRFFYLISAVLYSFAAYLAIRVLIGLERDDHKNSGQQISATLMEHEWGIWLVGLIGILVLIFAGIQFKHAATASFMQKFDQPAMTTLAKRLSQVVGRMGFAARGVVYLIIGWFFIHSAWKADPDEAGGLKEAFDTIMQQSYGQWILAIVGVGFFMFGCFCAIEARYHKT